MGVARTGLSQGEMFNIGINSDLKDESKSGDEWGWGEDEYLKSSTACAKALRQNRDYFA